MASEQGRAAQVKPILVVGAGFAGAVHARELAEAGWPVEVIDRRSHVAGTAHDMVDETGTRRHVFGPHLFHTSNARVVDWLSRFGDFLPYEHRVTALVPDKGCLPLPINRRTVNAVFGTTLTTAAEVEGFLAAQGVPHPMPRNAAEQLQAQIGVTLTDLFYRPYSRKMWGLELEDLDAAIVARIAIRADDEDRYFLNQRYQLLPRDGYTALVTRILDHPGIRVSLRQDFDPALLADVGFCFTSMAIDTFFDEVYGPLAYRSLRFHHRRVTTTYRLGPTAQVNLTDSSPFTRESDWSLLPGHRFGDGPDKTVTREEPCDSRDNDDERFYPVRDGAGHNEARYQRYVALAEKDPRVRFIGRCGTYRYLDMDQVINQSIQGARAWLRAHD